MHLGGPYANTKHIRDKLKIPQISKNTSDLQHESSKERLSLIDPSMKVLRERSLIQIPSKKSSSHMKIIDKGIGSDHLDNEQDMKSNSSIIVMSKALSNKHDANDNIPVTNNYVISAFNNNNESISSKENQNVCYKIPNINMNQNYKANSNNQQFQRQYSNFSPQYQYDSPIRSRNFLNKLSNRSLKERPILYDNHSNKSISNYQNIDHSNNNNSSNHSLLPRAKSHKKMIHIDDIKKKSILDISNISEKILKQQQHQKSQNFIKKNRKDIENTLKQMMIVNDISCSYNNNHHHIKDHSLPNINKPNKSGLITNATTIIQDLSSNREKYRSISHDNKFSHQKSTMQQHQASEHLKSNIDLELDISHYDVLIDDQQHQQYPKAGKNRNNRAIRLLRNDNHHNEDSQLNKELIKYDNSLKKNHSYSVNHGNIDNDISIKIKQPKDIAFQKNWKNQDYQNDIGMKLKSNLISSSNPEAQQDKYDLWRRLEVKSRQILTNNTTFDQELQKIENLYHRNKNALADLLSIRENLVDIQIEQGMQQGSDMQNNNMSNKKNVY